MSIISNYYDRNWEKHYYTDKDKGSVLARGRGIYSMGDVSYKNKWSNENSILDVKNPDSLDSSWTIYALKSETMKKVAEEKRIRDGNKK